MMASPSSADAVLGVWKLVSVRVQMEDTGETLDLLGADPKGFIVFGTDGRMMTVLSASGRMGPWRRFAPNPHTEAAMGAVAFRRDAWGRVGSANGSGSGGVLRSST